MEAQLNQKLNPSTISINPLDLNSILNSIIDIIGTGGDGNGLYGGDGDINNGTIATLLGNLTITSTVINPALDFDSTFISVEGTIASWNTVSGKKVLVRSRKTGEQLFVTSMNVLDKWLAVRPISDVEVK